MGISTHVLETSEGAPGANVSVALEIWRDSAWVRLNSSETDADGRCRDLLPVGTMATLGMYRVRFETGDFYAAKRKGCLYPYVEIVFEVKDERHHHIPLLLTANGYATYRGT